MSRVGKGRTRRTGTILLVVTGAVLLHVAGLILFHAESVGSRQREAERADVSLMPQGGAEEHSLALREQAVLLDSTPLFLPTRWNVVNEPAVRGLDRRPGDVFSVYAPELSLENFEIGETDLQETSPATLDGLRHIEAAPFHAFRGVPKSPAPLSERTVKFQVVLPATGEEVFSVSLDEPLPARGQLWGPAVFGVQVTTLGLAGAPVLLEGSGVEEVDSFFNQRLRESIFTKRLPEPGYYRVLVGP